MAEPRRLCRFLWRQTVPHLVLRWAPQARCLASLSSILHLWLGPLSVLTLELWAVGQPSRPFQQNDCPTSSSGKRFVPRMPISHQLPFSQRRNCIKASVRDLVGHSWAVQGQPSMGGETQMFSLPVTGRREGWRLCVRWCSTGHTPRSCCSTTVSSAPAPRVRHSSMLSCLSSRHTLFPALGPLPGSLILPIFPGPPSSLDCPKWSVHGHITASYPPVPNSGIQRLAPARPPGLRQQVISMSHSNAAMTPVCHGTQASEKQWCPWFSPCLSHVPSCPLHQRLWMPSASPVLSSSRLPSPHHQHASPTSFRPSTQPRCSYLRDKHPPSSPFILS